MAQISKYLRQVDGGGLTFWCQGCREAHTIWVGKGGGPRWTWNGDVEKPVFGPSVRVSGLRTMRDQFGNWNGRYLRGENGEPLPKLCHTFVGCNGAQPGEIFFLSDCTHELAGKVLPLAELPPHMRSPS